MLTSRIHTVNVRCCETEKRPSKFVQRVDKFKQKFNTFVDGVRQPFRDVEARRGDHLTKIHEDLKSLAESEFEMAAELAEDVQRQISDKLNQ